MDTYHHLQPLFIGTQMNAEPAAPDLRPVDRGRTASPRDHASGRRAKRPSEPRLPATPPNCPGQTRLSMPGLDRQMQINKVQSPSGNINCEIDYRRGYGTTDSAYCMSISPPQNVSMNSSGVLTVCTAGDSCLSNPPQAEPTLPYGHTTGIGPFTCLSESSGVTCTVGSGRGFAISKLGITPVG
jgi:hypothetical protein